MKIETLLKSIEQENIAPIYLLYGEEEYFVNTVLTSLKKRLSLEDPDCLNVDLLRGNEISVSSILEKAETLPFLSEIRLVVVKDIDAAPQDQLNKLSDYITSPCPSTCLVLTAKKVDNRRKFYAELIKKHISVSLNPLNQRQLHGWITKKSKQKKLLLDEQAKQALIELIGPNLIRMESELEKISLYAGDKEMGSDEIYNLIRGVVNESIFVMTDAMGKQDRKEALKILKMLLEQGEPPLMILSMIARQLRIIWIVKELKTQGTPYKEIPGKAGIPPFLVSKYSAMAKLYSVDMLKQGFYALTEVDRQLKSGMPPNINLENLVMQILQC